jgi:selenocysteine-specific elongation factor
MLDVVLTRSARLRRAVPMKSGASAYVHHGTTRTLAKIVLAENQSLAAGESAFAQLRLTAPLLGFLGDRFVVRDASEQHTLAGGVVLNPDSNPTDFRSAEQRALLAARAANPDDVDLAVWTEIARGIVQVSHLFQRSRFSEVEIATVLQRLCEHGDIFLHDDVAGKTLVWRELRDRAAKLIDAAHKANPERPGLELTNLRAGLESILPAVFDALMDDLCANGFVRAGSTIARGSHRPLLPPDLLPAAEKIRTALSAKLFDPPDRKSLSEDRHLQQALRFLIQQGEIVELNEEIVLLNEAAGQMRSAVVEFLSENGSATASQLRQKIGTSRRVIIPFLEYLDRIGVTQRVGDSRQLRETKSAAVARR